MSEETAIGYVYILENNSMPGFNKNWQDIPR